LRKPASQPFSNEMQNDRVVTVGGFFEAID